PGHRPDRRSPDGGGRRELDSPIWTIDRLVRSGPTVRGAEPEVIAMFVAVRDGATVGEPSRWNVRVVLRMPGDLACVTTTRIHHEKTLRRVIEDPHHQEPGAVGRPAADDVPERPGQ